MYEKYNPKYTPFLIETTFQSGAVGFLPVNNDSCHCMHQENINPINLLGVWGFPTTAPFEQTIQKAFLESNLLSTTKKDFWGNTSKINCGCPIWTSWFTCNTNEALKVMREELMKWEVTCFKMLADKLTELQAQ